MAYLPYAALFFLLLWFGMQDIYHWANKSPAAVNEAVQHKAVYLNIPFFFIRLVLYFLLWIIFAGKLRQVSLQEDKLDASDLDGIMNLFGKTELYSKIFLFILSVTFSLSAVDWIMSVDVNWYSTIFAL
jgi:fucose permease